MSRAFRGVVAFLAWTLFSFYAHFFARKALRSWENIPEGQLEAYPQKKALWYSVVILSLCQFIVGSCALFLLPRFCSRRVLHWMGLDTQGNNGRDDTGDNTGEKALGDVTNGEMPGSGHKPHHLDLSLPTLALSHMAATVCTNASLAFSDASSAFAVKAFEPISTAVLSSILSGKKLETNTIIALPLVVIGSIGFVWKTHFRVGETLGLSLAFLSNILFGLRNVTLKNMADRTTLAQFKALAQMSTGAGLLLLFLEVFLATAAPDMFPVLLAAGLLQPCFVSAMLHVTYTVISTCIILKYISVVAHSMANLMKRISLAMLFYMIGKHLLLPVNYISGVVIILGLLLYTFPAATRQKYCTEQQSLWLTGIMSSIVLGLAVYHWNATVVSSSSGTIVASGTPNTTADFQFPFSRMRPFTRTQLSLKDQSFVGADLYKDPANAFHLSQLMTTSEEVIEEAQRIQNVIFSRVLAGYTKAVLVNVFQWSNKGDQFITIGQRLILQRLNISIIYHCYYPGTYCDFSKIERSKDLVVMVQGAGYIGHPSHLFVLKKTAQAFPKNRIVHFPTSVCHPTPGCQNITEFADIYGRHSDFIVMLRDKPSFDMATQFFTKNKLLLVPDSAFAAGPLQMNIIPSYDVIWIKRNDWESYGFTQLNQPKFPPGIKYLITDWKADWMNENSDDFFEDHQLKAMSGVLFIARAHVVVTDRLHAHLISTLLGKPNVVVNSLTNKQANYYHTWERSIKTSYLAHSTSHAVEKALLLLKKYKPTV